VTDAEAGAPFEAAAEGSRFDARCQLCSRVAGQVVDGNFLHHPDCVRTPTIDRGMPRCCECGGQLYFEPTTSPMLSAAEREAARHARPSRW
jgi:hypothetical protein